MHVRFTPLKVSEATISSSSIYVPEKCLYRLLSHVALTEFFRAATKASFNVTLKGFNLTSLVSNNHFEAYILKTTATGNYHGV